MLSTILKLLAGIVDLIQSFVTQYHDDSEQQAGVNQEKATEAATKAHDEAIAAKVDAAPVPTDKPSILAGM